MTQEEIKILAESMVESSKLGTANALTYVQKGLEAYKVVKIPITSEDGQYCYGMRKPYKEDKQVQTFIDFMLVYLDEAIKTLEKGEKEHEKDEKEN